MRLFSPSKGSWKLARMHKPQRHFFSVKPRWKTDALLKARINSLLYMSTSAPWAGKGRDVINSLQKGLWKKKEKHYQTRWVMDPGLSVHSHYTACNSAVLLLIADLNSDAQDAFLISLTLSPSLPLSLFFQVMMCGKYLSSSVMQLQT